jgi:ribosomal protein S18 acetylase RimI-like enzyme
MSGAASLDGLRSLLETDRIWCAYALADLDPAYAPDCHWSMLPDAAVLIYQGLVPPVLFAHGEPASTHKLLGQVPEGRYQFGLMGVHRDLLGDRLQPEIEHAMWRMVLKPAAFPPQGDGAAQRLTPADLPAIRTLMADHPDRPDAFSEAQLEQGVFFGRWEDGALVCMAGTHVFAPGVGVAAVGNVFTRPDCRGQGYGTQATARVVAELLEQGVPTIVLNVAMDNHTATGVYRRLGFWPYRGYYEGIAHLAPPQ